MITSTNLFFSEYVEGSGNNKAIEIYNPDVSNIDLSNYSVKHSRNGSGWGMFDSNTEQAEFIYQLSGNLESGDVYVLTTTAASQDIINQSDVELSYPGVSHFNGDDAIGLFHNDILIDVIGIPDEDPETGWDVAGIPNATNNHTLIRKSSVIVGNTDWLSSAGTNDNDSEWIVYDQDYVVNLGSHVCCTIAENINPIADPGPNQTVIYGSSVTMSGSASADPDGTIESYSWSQTAGTTVDLSSTSAVEVSFTAPSSEDSLSFTLTVTDNNGAIGSATVYVKIVQSVTNAVFFSEYGEGNSNNKYLEIFNGTGEDIDLNQYAISSCSNGCDDYSTWDFPSNITFEPGTIVETGDVYVIAHPSADAQILAQGDATFTYLSNGNDAFGLVDASTGIVIDIIGEMGPDPGVGWGSDIWSCFSLAPSTELCCANFCEVYCT